MMIKYLVFVLVLSIVMSPAFAVNTKPLIDDITDVTIDEDSHPPRVNLTGISDGGDGTQELTVTASSSNITLIPNLYVDYSSPNTTGSLYYAVTYNENGSTIISVTVSDGIDTVTKTFTVTITPVNDAAPVAVDDDTTTVTTPSVLTTDEDTLLDIDTAEILSNDSDIERDVLSVTAVDATSGSGGTVSLVGTTITYTPASNFNGDDTFGYTISDGNGGTDTAIVTVTVTSVNDLPVAADDAGIVLEGGVVILNLAINDTDIDDGLDLASIVIISERTSGSVVILSGDIGKVAYTHNGSETTSDTFTYSINDNSGATSNAATVSITVTPKNDDPVADAQSVTTLENTALAITLTGSDIEGDSLTFTTTIPASGSLSGTAPNVTYTPNVNFFGSDSFDFTVDDGNDGTDTATVSITVTENDKLNMNTTYFESTITYDETVIPWQATVSCTIIVKIPNTYETQLLINDPKGGAYLTSSNNLSFTLPNIRADEIVGTCKIVKAGEATKYENFVLSIIDSDNDGIFNLFDLCPSVAEDHLGPNQSDGCPDTTPPNNPIITTQDKLFIHGRSDLNTTISLYVNDKYIGNTETKSNGKWVIPVSLPIGTHTVVVYATDTAGNISEGTTKQYTIKERNKTDTTDTTNTTTTNTGSTNKNNPYIVTPKVTPENVYPGITFTATCVEDHPDTKYSWHVAIYNSHPVDLRKALAQGMIKQSLEYPIPSDYPINQIVVTCWATLMDGTSHTSTTNSKILSLTVPEIDTGVKSIDNGQSTKKQKKSNGGCDDCTPPTLGLNKNFDRVVDDGFSYNGNMAQVEKWHTEFPLINATVGVPNLVEIKVYENTGITNMKWVQFCLGAEERGQPLNSCEVLIEVHLLTNGTTTDIAVQEIVINDKNNLIDNDTVTAVSYVVTCMDENPTPECVKVDLEYTYREETINHMLIVNVTDKARNSQNFHFNEGVNVLGESLNEPPTITLSNKHASQQKDNLHITYTRVDKIDDTWVDEFGIEYHRINDVTFDRITPPDSYECKDPTLDKVKVWKRTNCHFRDLTDIWS